jgi:DNA-binding transcriptional LysR family regulator
MRLSQIQDFIAVAEGGSIRAAARSRDVSAPALTKSIRQLEEELHVPLLTRTTRGVVLSHYGEAFLRRARLIAAEARRATEEMTQMLGARTGTVRIGVTGGPAHLLLPAALNRFRRQHPEVQVNIDSGRYAVHLQDLRAGLIDVAVSPIPDEGIEHDFIRARDLPLPHVAVRCDTFGIIQALLQDRRLLCMVARQLMQGRLAGTNGLAVLPIEDPLPSHTVCLVYRADSPMPPVVASFAAQLRREAHYLINMPDSPLRRPGAQPPLPSPLQDSAATQACAIARQARAIDPLMT